MDRNELLNEERFQSTKKKISKASIVVLLVGILIGGSLIGLGIVNKSKIAKRFSDANIKNVEEKVLAEKEKLEAKRIELTDKGITYNSFTKYTDGEDYDLKIITNVLDPSSSGCVFDEYKNNSLTSEYCLLQSELKYIKDSSNVNWHSEEYIPFFAIGGFITFTFGMISLVLFSASKQREILAYQAQQVMPVAQEGIEKMAPTIGKASATIAKEMAPVYGELAKEISKGIKDGLKGEEK